jgi:hypothetical protein
LIDEEKMEIDATQKRLFNKAHIFEPNAMRCSRCGSSVAEALGTPFRCSGLGGRWQIDDQPRTLTDAIDSAENP